MQYILGPLTSESVVTALQMPLNLLERISALV